VILGQEEEDRQLFRREKMEVLISLTETGCTVIQRRKDESVDFYSLVEPMGPF